MLATLFRPSRLVAVALGIAVIVWVGTGRFGNEPAEPGAVDGGIPASAAGQGAVMKVGVQLTSPVAHQSKVVLSCVTRADSRASAVTRGDVIARLSDEGRAASLAQAEALLDQRLADLEANKVLIERGIAPRNTLSALEAGVASARAALAAAKAESVRSVVVAPITGVVDSVPFQVGQAVQIGSEIAAIIDPDPMLAIGNVSEARRGSMVIGQDAVIRLIDGTTVAGTVGFVGITADKATRTYQVEATMPNPDAVIADGVSCEMTVTLAPIMAAAVPRSALVFADNGQLGIRIADENNLVQFVQVGIVDDSSDIFWVTGIDRPMAVITVGQEFVSEGDLVTAVPAAQANGR